jgi:virginiamycin B lyase
LLALAAVVAVWLGVAAPAQGIEVKSFRPGGMTDLSDITRGPDGNIWFTCRCQRIGRISPGGAVTTFPGVSDPSDGVSPEGITAGSDGNLWFIDGLNNRIGRITPAGVITLYSKGIHGQLGGKIVAGPDGNLWFTQPGGRVGRITTAGVVTVFRPMRAKGPANLTAGPDGNLWVTYPTVSRHGGWIVRLSPSGKSRRFAASPHGTRNFQPDPIAADPDGNLWYLPGGVVRMTPSGRVTEMTRPFGDPDVELEDLAQGPDGNMWVVETGSKAPGIGRLQLARITPSGALSEFPVRGVRSISQGAITSGPHGTLWVATFNRIIRIKPTPTSARVAPSGAFALPTIVGCLSTAGDCRVRTVVTAKRGATRIRLGGANFQIFGSTRERGWRIFSKRLTSSLSVAGQRLLRRRRSLDATVRTTVLTPDGIPARTTQSFAVQLR